MEKRGQVTIFIIISVLIVATILAIFFINNNSSIKSNVPVEVQPIDNFVKDCLKETSENALIRIGEQGGYFLIFDEPSVEGRIPYYFQGTLDSIISKQEIEQNLAGFVREELSFCILNFKDFREEYKINHEVKNVNVSILDNQVKFSLDYPITIIKDESSYEINKFSVNIPVRVKEIIEVSQEVVKEQKIHPESICLSCLYDLGKEYDVSIDMLDYGNSTIFIIIDDKYKLNNESYEWNFAIV